MLSTKQWIIWYHFYNVFGMTQSGIEPTTSSSWGECFTTEPLLWWLVQLCHKRGWNTPPSLYRIYYLKPLNCILSFLASYNLSIFFIISNLIFKVDKKECCVCRQSHYWQFLIFTKSIMISFMSENTSHEQDKPMPIWPYMYICMRFCLFHDQNSTHLCIKRGFVTSWSLTLTVLKFDTRNSWISCYLICKQQESRLVNHVNFILILCIISL